MFKIKCKEKGCKKSIEGYTKDHAKSLLSQHMIKHENDKRNGKNKKD